MTDVPRIRVVDVHKRFGELEVLRGVSFDVHRGNVVSVIGASGSGKSTLLALAPRLYDIADGSGAVLFDGVAVRDLRAADLRKAVALSSSCTRRPPSATPT